MKWTLGTTTVVLLLAFMACPRAAWAADPVEVFVDGRDPAFLVVQGVAPDTAAQARREMAGYAALEGVSLVAWSAFVQNAQALIGPHIVKNEYAGAALVPSVVALIKTYPGRAFAVTWNGGLAVSFQDYQYAVRTYRDFTTDAQVYERSRPRDPGADPVNPQNHLATLLNR